MSKSSRFGHIIKNLKLVKHKKFYHFSNSGQHFHRQAKLVQKEVFEIGIETMKSIWFGFAGYAHQDHQKKQPDALWAIHRPSYIGYRVSNLNIDSRTLDIVWATWTSTLIRRILALWIRSLNIFGLYAFVWGCWALASEIYSEIDRKPTWKIISKSSKYHKNAKCRNLENGAPESARCSFSQIG